MQARSRIKNDQKVGEPALSSKGEKQIKRLKYFLCEIRKEDFCFNFQKPFSYFWKLYSLETSETEFENQKFIRDANGK